MKKIIPLLLAFVFSNNFLAVAPADTASLKKIVAISKALDLQKSKADTLINLAKLHQVKNNCYDCSRRISCRQAFIICLPFTMFTLVFLIVIIMLKKSRFKLKRALSDDPVVLEVSNPKYDPANPNSAASTIKKVFFKSSASRLIAFLSGLTAIIIAVSSTTYFLYLYFRTGVEPNLDKLFDILLALGIGVTPYAVSKVSNAIAK